ncbi:MAG: hydrogenase maturation protease [Thermoplasmatota archaeon]
MTTIIVGIGNPILGDDGVGIHVARKLRPALEGKGIVIEEAFTGGLNLLDIIVGHDRAILVDSISSRELAIGEVVVVQDVSEIGSDHSANPHDVSFPEALELAGKMGETRVPKEISLVGINIRPSYDFKEGLSTEVASAVDIAAEKVRLLIE